MRKSTTPSKSPDTKPSVGKKLETETQNPLRKEGHRYQGIEPSYGKEELLGAKKIIRTQNDFKDDTDDDEEIFADITEAGVSAARMDLDKSRDDFVAEDREFELGKTGTEEAQGGLSDEDNDLENIPDRKATKIGDVKIDR
jgi:hypothetical protein